MLFCSSKLIEKERSNVTCVHYAKGLLWKLLSVFTKGKLRVLTINATKNLTWVLLIHPFTFHTKTQSHIWTNISKKQNDETRIPQPYDKSRMPISNEIIQFYQKRFQSSQKLLSKSEICLLRFEISIGKDFWIIIIKWIKKLIHACCLIRKLL